MVYKMGLVIGGFLIDCVALVLQIYCHLAVISSLCMSLGKFLFSLSLLSFWKRRVPLEVNCDPHSLSLQSIPKTHVTAHHGSEPLAETELSFSLAAWLDQKGIFGEGLDETMLAMHYFMLPFAKDIVVSL